MDADLVDAAAALRWARPDLTAELADHVLEEASAAGQRDRWLAAAGWAVHARAATGDGRDTACAVLAALGRWGGDALTGAAADRLRIELAMVAAGAGEVESARRLLAGVHADGGDPELTADLLCAHARCAVEDAPDEVAAALDAADAAWAMVGGTAAQLGGASVALVRAVVERRGGRPATAVDHASDGLARLERGRVGSGTPSGYLAAALAAEWISALLDAGRVTEARDGCAALLPRLSEQARPTRQLALLRLTVTRVLAAQGAGDETGQDGRADTALLLAQAAEDAAGCDVPDLEAVCRTALGALHEQAEQLEVALEALQLAVRAERRDRDRKRRFLAALAELPAEPERPQRRRERAEPPAAATVDATTSTDATTVLPAITRSDRKLRASRGEDEERGRSRFERLFDEPAPDEAEPAADEEAPTAWDAVPWNGSGDDSPIGDLLIRSLRAGSGRPAENGAPESGTAASGPDENRPARRNGKSIGAPGRHPAKPGPSAGWVPTLDADEASEERPRARRPGRPADTGRRRSRRAREERDDTSTEPRHVDPAGYPDDGSPGSAESSAAQERSGRRRRRAGHGDGEPADESRERTRGRHGSPGATDVPDGEGRRSRSTRGGRRRAEERSVTEPSSSRSAARGEAEPVADAAAPSDDSDGWLESALAELDRALSGIGVGKPVSIESTVSIEPTEPTEEPPSDDGCAVVVDIARDGRRFAGPRAAAVVRSVAELLADRLPPGARTRFGDSDALVVTGAGWSRADATDWMHRTLPGLLDGFVAAEELPGSQLRVAVHDADGPVGAQILQPLTAARERDTAEDLRHGGTARDPWAEVATSASEVRGQKYRAARAGRQERGSRGSGEPAADATDAAAVSAAAETAVHEGDSPRWPFSGDARQTDVEAVPDDTVSAGRHGSGRARPEVPPRDELADRGRRHRADSQDHTGRRRDVEGSRNGSSGNGSSGNGSAGHRSAGNGAANGSIPDTGGAGRRAKPDRGGATTATKQGDGSDGGSGAARRAPERAESTEGLGIADLLAGALAAYRGI